MPKAIRIQQTGGPEVLRFEDVALAAPAAGEARATTGSLVLLP